MQLFTWLIVSAAVPILAVMQILVLAWFGWHTVQELGWMTPAEA